MTFQSKILRAILILFLLAVAQQSHGQDNARYQMHVSPYMQIQALGSDRFATHPMTATNVNFNNQRWYARTSSGTGSTVTLSSDHAFHNLSDSNYKRDVRLQITQMAVTTGSGWQFDTVVDTTNYAAADETATVQVSSKRPGNAIIWLNVSFLTGNLATLKGGQYQMTVVGTISEN
jgi:hypothetical protein